jgi:transposase
MDAIFSEEVIARQPPEAQAIIRLALAKISALEAEIAELRAQYAKLQTEYVQLQTQYAQLQSENARLRAENAELRAEIAALKAENARLRAENAELRSRIEQLERQSKGKTPHNSSLPPSTQHPHARRKGPKPKSKRKRGGQPGHEKPERLLIPSQECDKQVLCKPKYCRRCGAKLSGSDPTPLQHQVWELPRIKPQVTEYLLHRLRCSCCGETTCGQLPPGVPKGQTGPKMMAFVGLLMAKYRQSKRQTAEFLSRLFGRPFSAALVVKIQHELTDAVRPHYEALVAELPKQRHLNIDETATKESNGKAWLWTFVARQFTVYAVRATREAVALKTFLGANFRGIVTCDRAKMYWWLERLQWCWSHLKRDFQAMIDRGTNYGRWLGSRLRRLTCELFEHWGNYRAGNISHKALLRRTGRIREKIEWLLFCGTRGPDAAVRGTCRELYEHRRRLWTFLHHDGVEPTNNAAERALRHPVIWRKLSFGTQSNKGSRFIETMLTVIETCRQQGRNVFTFLTDVMQAHLANQPAPSLLPGV